MTAMSNGRQSLNQSPNHSISQQSPNHSTSQSPNNHQITRSPNHQMCDVVVVGAGPAGTIAALVLARAGARVRLLDRATFPRDKLCGDTVNPGTLARLRALGVAGDLDRRALAVAGMRLTGGGIMIEGRYPRGHTGRAIVRRDLDAMLLQEAIAAGCEYEAGVAVRRAIVDEQSGGRRVTGVLLGGKSGERAVFAPVIGAAP